jgi:hypothetical protein
MYAHVAPATTTSTVLALVKPDNTATKLVVEVIMITSLAAKLPTRLQTMTGAKSSTMTNGVIRILADRAMDDGGNICTFGSLEMARRRCFATLASISYLSVDFQPCRNARRSRRGCPPLMPSTMSRRYHPGKSR